MEIKLRFSKHIQTQFQYWIRPNTNQAFIQPSVLKQLENLLVENDIEAYGKYISTNNYIEILKLNQKKKREKRLDY